MAEGNLRTTLILDPDNPYNTNIYDEDDGRILYSVATVNEHGRRTITRVQNSSGETIASWEWKEVRPDLITFGKSAPMPVTSWLKKSVIPFKDSVTFQDYSRRNLKWKGITPGLQLELFAEHDKKHPMARYAKSQRHSPSSQHAPGRLYVDSRGEQILDLVVISFLVLEKTRRTQESHLSWSPDASSTIPLSPSSQ